MSEMAADEIERHAAPRATLFENVLEFVRVALVGFAAVLVYGVVRDLVCVFVSLAYFTIAHVPPYGVRARVPLALIWGTQSTWMMGVLTGLACACAARLGAWPKLTAREFMPHALAIALVFVGVTLLYGLVAYTGAATSLTRLAEPWAGRISAEEHAGFLFVDAVHDDSGPDVVHALLFAWGLVLERGRRARGGA